MLWPREAGKFITGRAKDVKVLSEGVAKCSKVIVSAVKEGKLSKEHFLQNEVLPLDKGLNADQLANWVFIVDALNFNFWTPDGQPKFTVTHSGKKRVGYLAMVTAINRAIDEGKPMHDPMFYSKLTIPEIKDIFRSNTKSTIPLLEERAKILRDVGLKLLEKYDGNFMNLLKKANGSGRKLIELIIEDFSCFRDIHIYEGTEVAIFKRVQIVVADLWTLYRGEGYGHFEDIDELTMFADYRVPQVLSYYGVIQYTNQLQQKLNREHMFESGGREEVEIRGVSIEACELIAQESNRMLQEEGEKMRINSMLVDYFLWDYRIQNTSMLQKIPYHRTRCIYY